MLSVLNICTMKIADILESKVIAYHGTGRRFDQFHQSTVSGNYFTTDPEYAKGYVGKVGAVLGNPKRGRNYLVTVELTINQPFDTKTDPNAVQFYNEKFIPDLNAIFAKSKYPKELPPIELGKWVSFIWADDLYRYFSYYGSSGYDAIYVDEGGFSPLPAIVPLNASQIRILKREIAKF